MTPATTIGKVYQAQVQRENDRTATVKVAQEKNEGRLMRRIEAGITWFSRNLTGQANNPYSQL